MTTLVRVERRRGVDYLTLDSATNRNALSLQMLDELTAAVRTSAADDDSRGLVIDHEGATFCAGVDVKERRALPPGSANHSELLAALYRELWSYPKPVLCRVAGAARGGGGGLAVCADAVVATREATFAFTEVLVGVAPALVGAIAMAKLGSGGLVPWLLTGQTLDLAGAERVGLVSHVADGDGTAEIDSLVDAVGAAAPGAVRVTKLLVRDFVHVDVANVITEMTALSARLFDSPEAAEGMAAFAEKRSPSWAVTEVAQGRGSSGR